MFVTSQKYPPRFQPLENADAKCNDAATAGGLPGEYRAWLSTAAIYARDRLAGARGWVRRDGSPFADTVDDLVAGKIFNPPLLDEFGNEVRSGIDDFVATGTDATGYNVREPPATNLGKRPGHKRRLRHDGGPPSTGRLFSIDHLRAAHEDLLLRRRPDASPSRPRNAREDRAFVSDAPSRSVGGRDAADVACSTRPTRRASPKDVLALLATDDEWAAFAISRPERALDPPRRRTNQRRWFQSARGRPSRAPLNLTSEGRYLGITDYRLRPGAATPLDFPMNPVNDDCSNWNDTTANGYDRSRPLITDEWSGSYNFSMAPPPPSPLLPGTITGRVSGVARGAIQLVVQACAKAVAEAALQRAQRLAANPQLFGRPPLREAPDVANLMKPFATNRRAPGDVGANRRDRGGIRPARLLVVRGEESSSRTQVRNRSMASKLAGPDGAPCPSERSGRPRTGTAP